MSNDAENPPMAIHRHHTPDLAKAYAMDPGRHVGELSGSDEPRLSGGLARSPIACTCCPARPERGAAARGTVSALQHGMEAP